MPLHLLSPISTKFLQVEPIDWWLRQIFQGQQVLKQSKFHLLLITYSECKSLSRASVTAKGEETLLELQTLLLKWNTRLYHSFFKGKEKKELYSHANCAQHLFWRNLLPSMSEAKPWEDTWWHLNTSILWSRWDWKSDKHWGTEVSKG